MDLQRRFERCWLAPDARAVFEQLVRRWSEPHRHYHTLEHLEECLAWLDLVGGSRELELALWFHDAIYEPAKTDNEAASAALFARHATAGQLVERVSALILATATHAGEGEGDAALLSDIDLAILGAPPARYARFERDVRREYGQYDEATYAAGRRAVLSSFLERLAIYRTPYFQRLEAQARDNLARALSALPPARTCGNE